MITNYDKKLMNFLANHVPETIFLASGLEKNGINQDYLEVTSHGEGNPLVPTPDGVDEPRNRRVEVVVR